MILLALAMLAAPAALPAQPQRTHAKRKAPRLRRNARVVTLLPVIQPSRDPNRRYRVTDDRDHQIDFKTRIVERGTFKNCGVTGMPVCPSNGMPILKSEPN